VRLDDRVVDLAAREHVGEFMSDQFADTKLALRAAGRLIAMLVMPRHFAVPVVRGFGPRISFPHAVLLLPE